MNNFYGFLGICAKAGAVCSGAFAVEKLIKSNKAKLVIVANDASQNTKSDYIKLCNGYETEIRFFGSIEFLSKAIGKENRVALAITDDKFSQSLIQKMEKNSED